jgi:hypothetical protein
LIKTNVVGITFHVDSYWIKNKTSN